MVEHLDAQAQGEPNSPGWASSVVPMPWLELRRIGKKRWGVFLGPYSQLVLVTFRGSHPSAKEQFAVWKVTQRLLK